VAESFTTTQLHVLETELVLLLINVLVKKDTMVYNANSMIVSTNPSTHLVCAQRTAHVLHPINARVCMDSSGLNASYIIAPESRIMTRVYVPEMELVVNQMYVPALTVIMDMNVNSMIVTERYSIVPKCVLQMGRVQLPILVLVNLVTLG